MLEQEATEEFNLTGEKIRPVMLIQAERKARSETFTPERVKNALIDDFNIDAAHIAIATGAVDELGHRAHRLTQIILNSSLPWISCARDGIARLLMCCFLFAIPHRPQRLNKSYGRVLRMPCVTRKQREALNRAYAYVVSDQLTTTVQNLRDGLVQSGFERLDTRDLIRTEADDQQTADLFTQHSDLTVPLPEIAETVALPDEEALSALPKSLRDKVEFSPEAGTLTIKGGVTPEQARKVAETFKHPDLIRQVRERLNRHKRYRPPHLLGN